VDDRRTDVGALVLAGGAATRFGADKTRVELGGRTVLARAADAAATVAEQVVVVGPWAPDGRARTDEPTPRRGPAAALAFGLGRIGAPWALVVAGDHPMLRPELLELLVRRAVDGVADAVVPERDERDEPLVACYRCDVDQVARRLVDSGERSLRALLGSIHVDRVPEPEWRVVDPDARSFLDIDTPEDLELVRHLLGT
jgi:molybdopterin-guanine dinucleotide biosynthesis protein A